jgi:hypothetical protein
MVQTDEKRLSSIDDFVKSWSYSIVRHNQSPWLLKIKMAPYAKSCHIKSQFPLRQIVAVVMRDVLVTFVVVSDGIATDVG